MAVTIKELDGGKTIEVIVNEKLHKEDYATLVPPIEKSIRNNGKVRLLFEMLDFHGWDSGALWEDIKFDAKHFADFERIAMVGDKRWEKWMASFCKPFTTGKVKFFDIGQKEDAKQWVIGKR